MKKENIFNINLQIIINRKLYSNNIIDEGTFLLVQEKLLKRLHNLKEI